MVRLLPGVVGAEEALEDESFERGLLEYPHYTRPAEWQGRKVPEVLISGHHEKVRVWRQAPGRGGDEGRAGRISGSAIVAAGEQDRRRKRVMTTIIDTLDQEQIAKLERQDIPNSRPATRCA